PGPCARADKRFFTQVRGRAFLTDRTPRRDPTGPARPAGLRGQCPPASACGACLLLGFAPKACRPRRTVDRRLAVKALLLETATQVGTRVRLPFGAKSRGRRRPQAGAGGHSPQRAAASAQPSRTQRFSLTREKNQK